MRKSQLLALLCVVAIGLAGCASKRIVRAAPASVSTPPPEEPAPAPPAVTPPPAEATAEPAPETTLPAPPTVPAKRPVAPRPHPAPVETAEPAAPKQAPPQISPQLSPKDLEAAKANTTTNITTAERNLHQADGKALNPGQKDLTEKINGFLSQAHDAVRADDWVRALNLAEKARVLSAELVKSL
jgi:outer membrane biosynthesis protein TonB